MTPTNSKEQFVSAPNLHATFNNPQALPQRPYCANSVYKGGWGKRYLSYCEHRRHSPAVGFNNSPPPWAAACTRASDPGHGYSAIVKKNLWLQRHILAYRFTTSTPVRNTRISGPRLHQAMPTCMSIWFDGFHHEWIFLGDDNGSVHAFGLRNRMWQIKDSQIGAHCTHVQKFEHVEMCYVNKVHSEWITQIKYDDDLNAIVTSSMDGTVKLSDRADLLRSKSNSCDTF